MAKLESIVAVTNHFISDRLKLDTGFHKAACRYVVAHAPEELVIMQRERLESDVDYRQILPYVLIGRKNAEGKISSLVVYQRTKKVGESRLGGKHSIGLGGHVEICDVVIRGENAPNIIDIDGTVVMNIHRELEEEIQFFKDGVREPIGTDLFNLTELGFVVDNEVGDTKEGEIPVGQVHVGLVHLLLLKDNVTAEIIDPELHNVGERTLAEIRDQIDSGTVFEPWSKIIIEAIEASAV